MSLSSTLPLLLSPRVQATFELGRALLVKSSFGQRLNLTELAASVGRWVNPEDLVDMETYVPGYDVVFPLAVYHCGEPMFTHLSRFSGVHVPSPQVCVLMSVARH